MKVDKIIKNANIFTSAAVNFHASAFAVKDGKFVYDFHGYEGQACQKDIEPFMSDLEEVYGIHVTKQQEIWSNPDKISTMKYQAMNTNKNRG